MQSTLLRRFFSHSFFNNKLSINHYCSYMSFENINSILKCNPVKQKIKIQGWVKAIRKFKEFTFLNIEDGSNHKGLQILVNSNLWSSCDVKHGSSISVKGELIPSINPQQLMELKADNVAVIGDCDPDAFPFSSRTKHSYDYVRKFYHLRPRTKSFNNLFKIRSIASMSLHNYLQNNGYYQIHTPIITSNDCEGAGEVFLVESAKQLNGESSDTDDAPTDEKQNGKKHFFNLPVFLTVSGQLHLEAMACALSKVYTFGPTFRAENCRSTRHLSEFYMLEVEKAFINDLEDLLKIMEAMIKNSVKEVIEKGSEELEWFDKKMASGNLQHLRKLIDQDFLRISYTEAVTILKDKKDFSENIKWGNDLQKEHEDYIVKYCGNIPVFIFNYPSKIKPFYMKATEGNSDTVEAVDLLVPKVGELCGGSLREDDLNKLHQKMEGLESRDELEWYLDLRRFGSVPHGGFGIGFERYLQFLTGISNIRDTIPFPRWTHHCPM